MSERLLEVIDGDEGSIIVAVACGLPSRVIVTRRWPMGTMRRVRTADAAALAEHVAISTTGASAPADALSIVALGGSLSGAIVEALSLAWIVGAPDAMVIRHVVREDVPDVALSGSPYAIDGAPLAGVDKADDAILAAAAEGGYLSIRMRPRWDAVRSGAIPESVGALAARIARDANTSPLDPDRQFAWEVTL